MRVLIKCAYNKATDTTIELYKIIVWKLNKVKEEEKYFLQVKSNDNVLYQNYNKDKFKMLKRFNEYRVLLKCKVL